MEDGGRNRGLESRLLFQCEPYLAPRCLCIRSRPLHVMLTRYLGCRTLSSASGRSHILAVWLNILLLGKPSYNLICVRKTRSASLMTPLNFPENQTDRLEQNVGCNISKNTINTPVNSTRNGSRGQDRLVVKGVPKYQPRSMSSFVHSSTRLRSRLLLYVRPISRKSV